MGSTLARAFTFLLRPGVTIALLAIVIGMSIASVPSHRIHVDEAWIGEHARSLARSGHVHSSFFAGDDGRDAVIIIYHRLFVALGAVAVDLFGWSLASLRAVPLVASALLVAVISVLARRGMGLSPPAGMLAAALFLLVGLCFEHLKLYRPEPLCALLGVASFVALLRAVDDTSDETRARRDRRVPVVLGGIIAGLAALAHPYGLIYCFAGAAWLLLRRRWGWGGLFVVAAVLPLVPYLVDILSSMPEVRAQLASPVTRGKAELTALAPVINLLREHERLFRRPDIMLASLTTVVAAVALIRDGSKRHRQLLSYTALCTAALGAIATDKVETRYAMLVVPHFAVIIAAAVETVWSSPAERTPDRWLHPIAALLLLLMIGTGLVLQATCITTHRAPTVARQEQIAERLPEDATVIAPMTWIFGAPETQRIIALYAVAARDPSMRVTRATLQRAAATTHAAYVVTTRWSAPEERIDTALGDWEQVFADEDIGVWQIR